jgi:hypothetical protein
MSGQRGELGRRNLDPELLLQKGSGGEPVSDGPERPSISSCRQHAVFGWPDAYRSSGQLRPRQGAALSERTFSQWDHDLQSDTRPKSQNQASTWRGYAPLEPSLTHSTGHCFHFVSNGSSRGGTASAAEQAIQASSTNGQLSARFVQPLVALVGRQ